MLSREKQTEWFGPSNMTKQYNDSTCFGWREVERQIKRTYSNCTCYVSRFFSVIHLCTESNKSSNVPGNATKEESNYKPGIQISNFLFIKHGQDCNSSWAQCKIGSGTTSLIITRLIRVQFSFIFFHTLIVRDNLKFNCSSHSLWSFLFYVAFPFSKVSTCVGWLEQRS